MFSDSSIKTKVYALICSALASKNGLCAKWMPRKGPIAQELRRFMNLSPRSYRKLLVELTKVVETQMCANKWEEINYAHVPSVAMSNYMTAFWKHSPEKMQKYKNDLSEGKTKINSSALYPYNIINNIYMGKDVQLSDAQWKALPNYIPENSSILPMVDVSGSMCFPFVTGLIRPLDIAISLGIYCADKNTGPFKDLFLTFSSNPDFVHLKGTISQKLAQMQRSEWGMNTNLNKALEKVLHVAVTNKVPAEDMPKFLMILSDMQFDSSGTNTANQMIKEQYKKAGYAVPIIVYWNLAADKGNMPVTFKDKGTILVSGFSPSMMKTILEADYNSITPENIMKEALMVERYNYH